MSVGQAVKDRFRPPDARSVFEELIRVVVDGGISAQMSSAPKAAVPVDRRGRFVV